MAKTKIEIIEKKFHPDILYWDVQAKITFENGWDEIVNREIYDHRQPGDERGATEYVAGEIAAAYQIEEWE